MPQISTGRGLAPCQIDGFPEGCSRTLKGAIYLRPLATQDLTDDELEFIKQQYPEVYSKLRVIDAKAKAPLEKVEPSPEKVEVEEEKVDESAKVEQDAEQPAESFSLSVSSKKTKSR